MNGPMYNLQSLTTRLLFSTVRLECQEQDGGQCVGTAFFFAFRVDDQNSVPVLVTNKHVVRSATTCTFHLHGGATQGNFFKPDRAHLTVTVPVSTGPLRWIDHPVPEVDLCAMLYGPLRNVLVSQGKHPFCHPIMESRLPSSDELERLFAVEEVVMVGYPTGLWDHANNLPILRRGTTASHPAVRFCGKNEGVVDMACFPGSSGSPILIANEGAYATLDGLSAGTRLYLLGTLYAGPQHEADGSVSIVDVPTRIRAASTMHIPMHVGYYVRAEELLALKSTVFRSVGVTERT